MKVKKAFFCIQEGKSYEEGDTYTGKRKDLTSYMEKVAAKTQKKTAAPKTKKK